ncbi:hypothetical protein C8R44DRAFT_876339 [Mycena epipterygia]|nr:hypothetical protein C8R44DRAFT_876339 [Mycena epipterygia]
MTLLYCGSTPEPNGVLLEVHHLLEVDDRRARTRAEVVELEKLQGKWHKARTREEHDSELKLKEQRAGHSVPGRKLKQTITELKAAIQTARESDTKRMAASSHSKQARRDEAPYDKADHQLEEERKALRRRTRGSRSWDEGEEAHHKIEFTPQKLAVDAQNLV